MHFLVFYGSYRKDRQGIRAVKFLQSKLLNKGHKINFIDAKEVDLPILDKMYKEYDDGQAPKNMETLAQKIKSADGFIFVTGEYNHSIQPGLKNLIDHFLEEWYFRPSAIASYSAGSIAGMRASVHMRTILGEIGTPSIPSIFGIPKIQNNIKEDGSTDQEWLEKQADKFIQELEWYAQALKTQRDTNSTPY